MERPGGIGGSPAERAQGVDVQVPLLAIGRLPVARSAVTFSFACQILNTFPVPGWMMMECRTSSTLLMSRCQS
jgi:hypothetical protein